MRGKKRDRLVGPSLSNFQQARLEKELSGQLHGACVVLEDLSRLTEKCIINLLEVDDAGRIRSLVDVSDRARSVLSMVQNVVGLCSELKRIMFMEGKAFVS